MIKINKLHNLSSTTSNSLSKQILLHNLPIKQRNPHSFTAYNIVLRIINTSHCSTLYWWSLVVHRQMYHSLEICSSEDLIYNWLIRLSLDYKLQNQEFTTAQLLIINPLFLSWHAFFPLYKPPVGSHSWCVQ